MATHHRTAVVEGHEIAYREAGSPDAPVLVLLHGFPTSSYMFRHLIPLLEDRYHVIAPDHIGFGQSAAPAVDQYEYSFDALARTTDALLDSLGVGDHAMFVQDYGAPVGWRLLLSGRRRITAIVSQNGNAYEEGFIASFWDPLWAYAENPSPETETPLRAALTEEAIRWQYTHGVPDVTLVDPDSWRHDYTLVSRPGNDEVQLALFRDYATNRDLYPKLQAHLREQQTPLLAVWGANDEIFDADGARAFARDLPQAEIHLLDAGHFALESDLDTIAGYMRGFLGRTL